MCNHATYQQNKNTSFEKTFRLADFFDAHWDNYCQKPNHFIKPEQYKAVNAIRLCRTDALGKDIYGCLDCNQTIEIKHNCKNRFCPTCSWNDTLKWGDSMQNMLLNTPHRHVVMTLPHGLNNLVMFNQKVLTDALLEISANIMSEHLLKTFGIKAGVVAVLHTFGEKKNIHLHVHMIVSWGGISTKSLELVDIKNQYINFDTLKEQFKNKYLKRVEKLYKKEQLVHRFLNQEIFDKFIYSHKKQKWILHLEPPMKLPTQVIVYIGRYSKRACLSEYKITKIEGETIAFRYKDYKEKDKNGKPVEKNLKLHYNDFFPLLLQHVPIPYFRMVRYYGIYNHRSKFNKKHLSVNQPKTEQHIIEVQSQAIELNDINVCIICKGTMIYIQTLMTRSTHKEMIYIKKTLKKRNENILKNVA